MSTSEIEFWGICPEVEPQTSIYFPQRESQWQQESTSSCNNGSGFYSILKQIGTANRKGLDGTNLICEIQRVSSCGGNLEAPLRNIARLAFTWLQMWQICCAVSISNLCVVLHLQIDGTSDRTQGDLPTIQVRVNPLGCATASFAPSTDTCRQNTTFLSVSQETILFSRNTRPRRHKLFINHFSSFWERIFSCSFASNWVQMSEARVNTWKFLFHSLVTQIWAELLQKTACL